MKAEIILSKNTNDEKDKKILELLENIGKLESANKQLNDEREKQINEITNQISASKESEEKVSKFSLTGCSRTKAINEDDKQIKY